VSVELTSLLSVGIGIAGSALAFVTYRTNQILKRQEILLPIIRDFERSDNNLRHARRILEHYILNQGKKGNEGWDIKEPNYYSKKNLCKILRYHEAGKKQDVEGVDGPVDDQGEMEIRNSFAALLDFLGALGYLLDIRVISPKEVRYFQYYINEARNDRAIVRYAQLYNFDLFALLLDKLKIFDPSLSEIYAAYRLGFR
jgi:hypothetical protein